LFKLRHAGLCIEYMAIAADMLDFNLRIISKKVSGDQVVAMASGRVFSLHMMTVFCLLARPNNFVMPSMNQPCFITTDNSTSCK